MYAARICPGVLILLDAMCRASELVNTDKNAKLALRRAAEIQEMCQKGLEQFPAARKLPQLSRVQVLW